MSEKNEPSGEDVIVGDDVACKGTRGCTTPAHHRCPRCRRPLCGRHAKRWGSKGRVCHKCRHTFESLPAAIAIAHPVPELEDEPHDDDDLAPTVSDRERHPPGMTVFVLDRDRAPRQAHFSAHGRALLSRKWCRSSARSGEKISVVVSNETIAPALRSVQRTSRTGRRYRSASRATSPRPQEQLQIGLFV